MTATIRSTQTHFIVELVSEQGKKYEIGYPVDAGYTLSEIQESLKGAPSLEASWLEVSWVPGAAQTSPSNAVRDRGIAEGYVSHDRGHIWEYRLNFRNTKGWWFKFKDKTGDVYKCSTIRNGWHYIDYNSADATIVAIQ